MVKKTIAIVTGANSGFGKEFVKLFSKDKTISEIWAIARNEEKLQKLINEIDSNIKIFSKDLSDLNQVKEVGQLLKDKNINIKYLVNNAGFAKFCSYGDISVDESINMINLNINAVVALGLICIPYMEKGSHIINVSSQAAFFPLPYQNIYSSTKAFIRNYTRALNVELRNTGITAIAVCPGWMNTGLIDNALIGADKSVKNFYGMVSPEVVAKKALKDANDNKDISIYSLYVKFTHIMSKILPQRLIMKLWLIQQKIK